MNEAWSEKNAEMQQLLKKEATYDAGIRCLTELRNSLFTQIIQIIHAYPREALARQPFSGAAGFHSKTLAYSVWHIFRIEDIVAHELIAGDEQVFFSGHWGEKIGGGMITTGNELEGDDIVTFSAALDPQALLAYAAAVKESTDGILKALPWPELKRRFTEKDREHLRRSGCVSADPKADWLVDYWCGKNVAALIRMPFSRHWIMHVEAMCRIKNKLYKDERKGVDPVAYCGFSCRHCFLAEGCGSCRTNYNTCSYALCSADGVCPNTRCCTAHGFDGCWECPELAQCKKGFYGNGDDGNAAKAQAMFIGKYGKKAFLKLQDNLHSKYDFQKTQEVLGYDVGDALRIMEENMK